MGGVRRPRGKAGVQATGEEAPLRSSAAAAGGVLGALFASKILNGFKPEYESTVTQNLKNALLLLLSHLYF